ncbi:hypothetical protein V2J09_016756 [Rumex salicifolius]
MRRGSRDTCVLRTVASILLAFNHLFQDCYLAKGIWMTIQPPTSWTDFFAMEFSGWLRTNLMLNGPNENGVDWPSLFAIAVW